MGLVSSVYVNVYGPQRKKKKGAPSRRAQTAKKAREFSTDLKGRATEAELRFQELLKQYEFAHEFQKPFKHAGTFVIVDFYLPDYQVVVEIDGEYHDDEIQKWKDQMRTCRLMAKNNIKSVVRFSNDQVMEDPKAVIRTLCKAILPQCKMFGV